MDDYLRGRILFSGAFLSGLFLGAASMSSTILTNVLFFICSILSIAVGFWVMFGYKIIVLSDNRLEQFKKMEIK